MCHEHSHQLIQTFRILIVEATNSGTIEIEDAEKSFTVEDRDHDLRVRRDVARDVSGKLVYVWNDDRLTLFGRHSTDALAHRNTNTRRIALKWSKHQFLTLQEIESGPIHIRQ